MVLEGGTEAIRTAREALDTSVVVADRLGSPALLLRAISDRLALALQSAADDPAPWRERLAALVGTYEDQAPTPDIEQARELLAT